TLATRSPSSASFVGRTFDRKLLVFRDLRVGQGMRVDLRIRNLAREQRPTRIRIAFEADLAELFAVKKGVALPVQTPCEAEGSTLRFPGDGRHRGFIVRATDARAEPAGALTWQVELEIGR